jgi:hypothetical protein
MASAVPAETGTRDELSRCRPASATGAAVINMIRQTGLTLGAAIIAATTLLRDSQ